jgi:2-haloacid dehalogenase
MDPHFEKVYGQVSARQEWFSQRLRSAFVATITDVYSDFSNLGGAALELTAKRHEVSLTAGERADILEAMRKLAPHANVVDGLERLRRAGLRLAELTNSTGKVVEAQLTHADLEGYFEQVLSADSVRRLKPRPKLIEWRRSDLA